MIIVKSKNNIPIRLTFERWNHIIMQHPEMEGQKERVLETTSEPQFIQQGDFGELIAVRFYETTPLTSKYLIVVYKESMTDGFIITADYAVKSSTRRTIVWKQ